MTYAIITRALPDSTVIDNVIELITPGTSTEDKFTFVMITNGNTIICGCTILIHTVPNAIFIDITSCLTKYE